jgi:hypothetical protein
VKHFRDKLKCTEEYAFRSYQTELDYAAHYKERGYSVELEPQLAGSEKNPEFVIESEGLRIYFEAKNIFWEEMMKEQALTTQIQGVLGKVKQPYVFSVFFSPQMSIRDVALLKKLFVKTVGEISPKQDFPFSIKCQTNGIILAEIRVYGKPNKLPYGYLGGLQRSGAFEFPKPEIIRRKLSKKVSQLPENQANVIVVEPGVIGLDRDTMVEVLYGDELVLFQKDLTAKTVRKRNGFYQPNQNTRISATVFSKKKFKEESPSFVRWESVFHNPFAKRALDRRIFDDKNVEQFVPVETKDAIKMEWC